MITRASLLVSALLCSLLPAPAAGSGTGHAGVYVSGAEHRIDGNHVAGNGIGILVEDATNLIVRNSATGNGDSYDIASCNDAGPIGFASAATSPWANIEH